MVKAETIGQAEIVGAERNKHIRVGKKGLLSPRTTRVFFGINNLGEIHPVPVSKLQGIDSSGYPHLEKGAQRYIDLPILPSWSTVYKRKTAIRGTAMKDSGYRAPKTGGFGSPHELLEVARLRETKRLKRELTRVEISPGQLFLLMHSAYHSQTLLEQPLSKKIYHKTGGFQSPKEAKIMRKQLRKNNKVLARSKNIFRY